MTVRAIMSAFSQTTAETLGPKTARRLGGGLAGGLLAAALLAAPVTQPLAQQWGSQAGTQQAGTQQAGTANFAQLAEPVGLRQDILIAEDIVTLGDIFTGLGAAGETPVARAPQPGESVTLNARWLQRVAETYEVDWRPRSTLDETRLTRDSQSLGQNAIVEALRGALEDHGVGDRIEIALDNPAQRLFLPTTAPGILTATGLSLNGATGRFQATLLAGDPASPSQRVPVAGRVFRLVEVPVPTRRISVGDVIRENDLEWVEVRADTLSPRDALQMEDMVGQSARRGLTAGEVVRLNQIEQPVLVGRNKLVTIELITSTMRLSARGRALDDGARGDMVRVVNTASNKTVMAVVTADATVAVQPDVALP